MTEQIVPQSYADYCRQAEEMANRALRVEYHQPELSIYDIIGLAATAVWSFPAHLRNRHEILNNPDLPSIVGNDPPSLRSFLWLELITLELSGHSSDFPEVCTPINRSRPYKLLTLTRSWISGMDDVMDSTEPPLTKTNLVENGDLSEIQNSLARYFLDSYRNLNNSSAKVRQTLRQYRNFRDLWLQAYNEYENQPMEFDQALEYNALTMSPMTYLLIETAGGFGGIDPKIKSELQYALTLYAIAGKVIDDITDWVKDDSNGELNLLTLALHESDEYDNLVYNSRYIRSLGKRTFIPVTLLKKWAPQATKRCFMEVDRLIHELSKTKFTHLSGSLKAIRQATWAYALNEGLPQVSIEQT